LKDNNNVHITIQR